MCVSGRPAWAGLGFAPWLAYVKLGHADGVDEGAHELHDGHQEDRWQQLLRPVHHHHRRLDEVSHTVARDVMASPTQPDRPPVTLVSHWPSPVVSMASVVLLHLSICRLTKFENFSRAPRKTRDR